MKTLFIILFSLISLGVSGQVATLKLEDGTFIVNAPSNRDWYDYNVRGVDVSFDVGDTLIVDNEVLNKIGYFGNWRHSNDSTFGPPLPGVSGCSCSYSSTINDSIVFMFTNANHFEWRGELMSHHGIVDVYWNDVYQGEIDTYDARNMAFTRNFVKDNLDTSQVYKFKLVVTGRKNANSTGAYVVNHGFKIWKDSKVIPEPCIPEIVYVTDTVVIRDTIKVPPDTIWMVPVFEYKPYGGSIFR